MNIRLPISFLLGGLVTFALFFMIQQMIVPGDPTELIAVRGLPIDFIRLQRDPQLTLKKRARPDRPTRLKAPSSMPMLTDKYVPAPKSLSAIMQPPLSSELGFVGPPLFLFPGEDMDTVPLYRIPPQYPLHAKRRGLEGWVDLEFSISKSGRVVEPVVLRADPLGVFDQAARAAVIKWRYRPKFDQGMAVEREGLTVRIWFELQDE